MTRHWLISGLIAVAAALPVAQTPASDARLFPQEGVTVWDKPDHFWFRKSLAGGNVWLAVDAVHGVKEPLFDHQRLAIELGVRGAGEFTPLNLPLADPAAAFVVKYDGANAYIQEGAMAIEFNLDGQFWRCDLQIKWNWNLVPPTDYECLPRRAATATTATTSGPLSVISPDGAFEAMVLGHNVGVLRRSPADRGRAITTDGVRLLTRDGTADDGYQPGSIQWSKDSKTITAYRVHADVWRSASLTGNVKKQIVKGQWPAQ
jgi:hypothetical protein